MARVYRGNIEAHPASEVIMPSLSNERVVFGLDASPFFVNDYDDVQRLWQRSRPQM